jgi:hypothetical protein
MMRLRLLPLLLACTAFPAAAVGFQQPGDEELVPVLIVAPTDLPTPLRPTARPLLVGLTSRENIRSGFPYRIGFYQVDGMKALEGGGLFGLTVQGLKASPACAPGLFGVAEQPCRHLEALLAPPYAGSNGVGIGLGYQFSSGASVGIGISEQSGQDLYAASLNPALTWPQQSLALTWLQPLPTAGSLAVQTRDVAVGADLDTRFGRFGLGLGYGRSESGFQSLQRGALALRWLYGSLGGHLGTQAYDFSGKPIWGGFDIGLSWRTPWQATLQVGARQVPARSQNPALPSPQRGSAMEELEPMPYVHYTQDL